MGLAYGLDAVQSRPSCNLHFWKKGLVQQMSRHWTLWGCDSFGWRPLWDEIGCLLWL